MIALHVFSYIEIHGKCSPILVFVKLEQIRLPISDSVQHIYCLVLVSQIRSSLYDKDE